MLTVLACAITTAGVQFRFRPRTDPVALAYAFTGGVVAGRRPVR